MTSLDKIKSAGIVGAGGAGFPTHTKLASKAEYVLLNGAECEPLLRVDQQLMEIYPKEIISGLLEAKNIVEAKKAIIGIKGKHKEAIEALNNTIKEMNLQDTVSVGILPDVYPSGDEQVLVYELTGRVVPELGIPIAVGCVVVNAETTLNIYNAMNDNPVTLKYVTVTGDVPNPVTVIVPVGTKIREVLEQSCRKDFTNYDVIDGGPMMGPLVRSIDDFITKKSKGFVVLPKTHSLIAKKSRTMQSAVRLNKAACEQCRLCTDLCPRHLLGHSTSPHKMVRAVAFGFEADENMTCAQTCCQCNLCDYFSCPAGINPRMANVYYMTMLREKGIKHHAKDSYTAREMRKYRLIPSKRLIKRLDLAEFDKKAPLDIQNIYKPESVSISLTAHVGAPAKPIVAVGDIVSKNQLIAEIQEGKLGANAHASIDGEVIGVDEKYITIRRK